MVSSELIEIECRRVLHRCRLAGEFDDEALAVARERLDAVLAGIDLLELSTQIKQRAMDPFPVHVRTLDALHIATALAVAADARWDRTVLTRQGYERMRQKSRHHGSLGLISGWPMAAVDGFDRSWITPADLARAVTAQQASTDRQLAEVVAQIATITSQQAVGVNLRVGADEKRAGTTRYRGSAAFQVPRNVLPGQHRGRGPAPRMPRSARASQMSDLHCRWFPRLRFRTR